MSLSFGSGEVLVCHRGDKQEQITSHTSMELPVLAVLGNRRIWELVDTPRIREA